MFEGNADVNVPQNPDSAMADSKPNNQKNNIAKINDFHAEAAKILVAMSSSGGAIHTNAEMCTLEHAATQGALAPSLSPAAGSSAIQTPAAITSDNASNIVASIENDDVEEQTAHISSNATIRASCVPTTLTTSNARTTYEEAARGIIEHVIMTPERTILSGRVEVVLTATQREKQPAKRTRPDVEIEQEADHNDAMEIDTQDNANATQNENTDTDSMIVVLPATHLCRVQAQAQVGSVSCKTNATDQAGNRKPADKDKSKAPAADQTNDATTMIESVECTSLQGRALSHDSPPPTHKPSKAPHRAQTTTALHFLQTTANPETVEDLARRAELNNANELARRIGVRPSVRQVGPLPGLDFAIVDLEASINAVRAATQGENRDQTIASGQGASSSAAAAASARPHTTFTGVYIHTARCDNCDSRNQSVLFRCKDCSNQLCRPCMEEDPIHRTDGLDWTDHGAQSASKPRSNPGAPRQRQPKVEKQRPKPKSNRRGPATKIPKTKPTVAQNTVRSGVKNLNSPRNFPAGVAAINARTRRLKTDGADDEDDEHEHEVEFMGQRSHDRTGVDGRDIGNSAVGRPASSIGGGSILGKRTREPRRRFDRHLVNFNPVGASLPFPGPSHLQPSRASSPSAGLVILRPLSPRLGPSSVQPPNQIKQESEEEDEVFFSVYDRENNTKEVKAEKKRAAKRHKGPLRRGVGLSQEHITQEDDEESGSGSDTSASALQASRRQAITFRTGGQTQSLCPTRPRPSLAGQNDPAQAGHTERALRSASPAGICPVVYGFLAKTDHLRSDYTRVTQEEAGLEEQLARTRSEKAEIEKGFRDLMK